MIHDTTGVSLHYSVQDSSIFLNSLTPSSFHNKSILLIYDPFKAAIDWKALAPFLNSWCEVIINHMVHDTSRGAGNAKKEEIIKRYEKTYLMRINKIVEYSSDRDKLDQIVINIIKRIVRNNSREHFIASFPFYNRNNGLVYNLLLCTSNIEGMKLYKKVAWKSFNGHSSAKNKHGLENQFQFNFDDGTISTETDEHCYTIADIAKYIYEKYHSYDKIKLDDVYFDLDRHPVFPTDGFKAEIKAELKRTYNVTVSKETGKQYLVFKKGI